MATNVAIDDALLAEALRCGGQRTNEDTVNQSLREYIERRQQAAIVDLFGTIDIDASYDDRKRRRRSSR